MDSYFHSGLCDNQYYVRLHYCLSFIAFDSTNLNMLCATSGPHDRYRYVGHFFLEGWAIFSQKIFRQHRKNGKSISSNSMLSTSWFHEIHLIPIQNQGYMLTSITLDCIIAYCLLRFRQYKFVTSCVLHDSRYRHMGQFFVGSWQLSHLCLENILTAPQKTTNLTRSNNLLSTSWNRLHHSH